MVTACKAESKNEEACDKVRARSAVMTKPVEGTTKLGEPDCQINVCPDEGRTEQQPHQCPK